METARLLQTLPPAPSALPIERLTQFIEDADDE